MKRKIHRSFLVLIVTFTVLAVHLGTIINNSSFLSVGLNQSRRTLVVASQRGTIYDRNLTPLNNTETQYWGTLVPDLSQLYRIRNMMDEQEYQRLVTEVKQQKLLIGKLNKAAYSGQKLRTFAVPKRYGDSVPSVHLLGYLDESGTIGQTGIEKAYNTQLEQYTGKITVAFEVNGAGACQPDQTLKVTNTIGRSKGGVQLTIDATIQHTLDKLASCYITKGAAAILDAKTSEIIACTSLPTFHPERIQDSIEQKNGALLNRILAGYDSGSVFKIVTAAAALESGVTPAQNYTCSGEMRVENTLFHCHHRLGHQTLNMNEAFAQSCNLYFIQLAQQIGGEAILKAARALGLYDSIELAEGLSAPAAVLPELSELYPAALANLSFGQGELLISPLHVAQLTATVANNGIRHTPSVVLGTVDEQGNQAPTEKGRGERVITEHTAAQLRWMMEQVVSDGTGVRAQPSDRPAAGKTGTAQTGQFNENSPVIQSWFTGYYPAENPRYCITILAEDAANLGGDPQTLFKELCNKLY